MAKIETEQTGVKNLEIEGAGINDASTASAAGVAPDEAAASAGDAHGAERAAEDLASCDDLEQHEAHAAAVLHDEEGIEELLSEIEEDDDSEDSLTYSNGVIEKIVAMATREVPHVLGMKGNLMHLVQETFGAENLSKGVTIEVTDDNRVVVNISVIIEYGCYAPAIFEDVKERVTERLTAMTGLEVAGINLRIEDVVTRDEYEASRRRHNEDAE